MGNPEVSGNRLQSGFTSADSIDLLSPFSFVSFCGMLDLGPIPQLRIQGKLKATLSLNLDRGNT